MPVATLALIALTSTAPSTAAEIYIKRDLGVSRHQAVAVDLNGDRRAEIIALATDARFCGSGGCTLYVLSPSGGSYRVVTRMSVTRPPVRVLDSVSNGWRDLSVRVGGGGVTRPYDVRLRFDGRSYPRNPTVAPATRLRSGEGRSLLR